MKTLQIEKFRQEKVIKEEKYSEIYKGIKIKYNEYCETWEVEDGNKDLESEHTSLKEAKRFIDDRIDKPNLYKLNVPIFVDDDWEIHSTFYKEGVITSIRPQDHYNGLWVQFPDEKRKKIDIKDTYIKSTKNKELIKQMKVLDKQKDSLKKQINKIDDTIEKNKEQMEKVTYEYIEQEQEKLKTKTKKA
jgi:hypothetical protein